MKWAQLGVGWAYGHRLEREREDLARLRALEEDSLTEKKKLRAMLQGKILERKE